MVPYGLQDMVLTSYGSSNTCMHFGQNLFKFCTIFGCDIMLIILWFVQFFFPISQLFIGSSIVFLFLANKYGIEFGYFVLQSFGGIKMNF